MSNGELPYRISMSDSQRRLVTELRARATSEAERRAVGEAFEHIIPLLQSEPPTWGDPIRDLHHAGLHVRRGHHNGILVEYAIDQARRIVYVARIRLAPWHPLYREGD